MAPRITEAFNILGDTIVSSQERAAEVLLVTSAPTFALKWLTGHLGSFQMKNPEIAVRLDTSAATLDFARDPIDIAIRLGMGEWPGLVAHRVLRHDFTPVLSPELARSFKIEKPVDLLNMPIISSGGRRWGSWFAMAGVEYPEIDTSGLSAFGNSALDASAAMAGQGVAIVNPKLYSDDIASGKLVQPFDFCCNDGKDYWLVYPHSRRRTPKIIAFREWMRSELETFEK